MRTLTRFSLLAAMPLLVLAMTAPTFANTKVGTATFTGIVRHVSDNNIKVYDPKNNQTLSFLILPKFDQIFSSDGKSTYQMKDIKPGRYVKIYYDQKLLGSRHADRILLLNQGNQVLRKE
jgi:uncharacterized protein (UPF0333 family)